MKKPLRVAMLIQGFHPLIGGAERQLLTLIPALHALNIEAVVITRCYPGLQPFEMIDNIPVYRLPIPGSKAVKALSFILTAMPRLKKLQPDVIHCFELLSPATAGILAKWLFKTPIAATVLRGGAIGDVSTLQNKTSGKLRLALLRKYIDLFLVISQEIDRELESVAVPPHKRSFLPNGVRTDVFAPVDDISTLRARLGLANHPIVIFTGRLVPEKRVDLLIQAWPQVRENFPNAELLILGTGRLENELKQKAGAGIRFFGSVQDVSPYLQAADVFILPSDQEGLSVSMLEAMSTGLPVVITAVGGALDVIVDGVNGRLIPAGEVQAITQAICKLLNDPEARHKYGTTARNLILESYALEVVAKKLAQRYQSLVTGSLKSGVEVS